jgi:hypothetical protein
VLLERRLPPLTEDPPNGSESSPRDLAVRDKQSAVETVQILEEL